MASQKPIDANRRNATRHGLTSTRAIALPEENLQEFNDLLDDLCVQFQPQSAFERSLILQLAAADWRPRRCPPAPRALTSILTKQNTHDRCPGHPRQ